MRIAYTCFVAATIYALCGMSLGLWMGTHEDFTLAPVHAHVNLLGWVTLGLYGLYHRGVARSDNRLAWVQVGVAIVGMPLLAIGLAVYLANGSHATAPMIGIGSLLSIAGMALFLVVLVRDARRGRGEVLTGLAHLV